MREPFLNEEDGQNLGRRVDDLMLALQPGYLYPQGTQQPQAEACVALGCMKVNIFLEETLSTLSDDHRLLTCLRIAASLDGTYRESQDRILLRSTLWVKVHCPFHCLSSPHQALYRLMIFFQHYHYPDVIADGCSARWCLHLQDRLCEAYWELSVAQRSGWAMSAGQTNSNVLLLLLCNDIDLEPWCSAETYVYNELPLTPALDWVKRMDIASRLFPHLYPLEIVDEPDIEKTISYALHLLRPTGLFAHDATDQATPNCERMDVQ